MENTTHIEITTVTRQYSVTERATLISFLLLCCVWIVAVNTLTFLCLFFNRKTLKQFVTLQLLGLSLTDILVGLSAIPLTLTFYGTSAFSSGTICAGIMYGYVVAQVASLFHVFAICLHRFITIKYHRFNSQQYGEGMLKRILWHIVIVWFSAISLSAIPFLRFAKFGNNIEECSLNTLFGDNYLNAFAVMVVFSVTPQVGVNVVYICLFRFLSRQWSRVDNSSLTRAPISASVDQKSVKICKNVDGNIRTCNEDSRIPHIQSDRHNKLDVPKNLMPFKLIETDTSFKTAVMPSNVIGQNNQNVTSPIENTKVEATSFETGGYNSNNKERDVLCTIGIVLLLLNLCMTPLNLTVLLELFHHDPLSRTVKFIFTFLALLNSGLNPIVYAVKMKPFREIVSRYKCKLCCKN